ncbi:MAG TPA: maltotransferase domain-containing protein, partial [Candidatus Dormibacteraeota bacterium]|nr:maltotransferase domain-containing protein [Candidatus Dormibacteraeota bacterium]
MARAPVRRRAERSPSQAEATASPVPDVADGRKRVVIEAVSPEIDGARFPAKRVVGETVTVEADIFADGHDTLAAALRFRHESSADWTEAPMTALVNDRWRGEFPVTELGRYFFTLEGWVDPFQTWTRRLAKRVQAGQDVTVELEVGARIVDAAAARANGASADAARLTTLSAALRKGGAAANEALDGELSGLMRRYAERGSATTYARELEVSVDPIKARFSSWYELFPRSVGTLNDVERLLPDIAQMGFDVLYMPPIHPIGTTHRKGANNKPAAPGEPGSPWAIGSL